MSLPSNSIGLKLCFDLAELDWRAKPKVSTMRIKVIAFTEKNCLAFYKFEPDAVLEWIEADTKKKYTK